MTIRKIKTCRHSRYLLIAIASVAASVILKGNRNFRSGRLISCGSAPTDHLNTSLPNVWDASRASLSAGGRKQRASRELETVFFFWMLNWARLLHHIKDLHTASHTGPLRKR